MICLTDQPNEGLMRQTLFTVGKFYAVRLAVSSIDGVASVSGVGYLNGTPNNIFPKNTTEVDGDFVIVGYAYNTDLVINLDSGTSACIDFVQVYEITPFKLYHPSTNTYAPLTFSVTVVDNYIVYMVDWETTGVTGIYQIVSEDLEIISKPIDIQVNHPCTLVLRWSCNSDSYNFGFINNYPLFVLRVEAKLGNPTYSNVRKEQYADASGMIRTLYNNKRKFSNLRIAEAPEYIHDAIDVGLDCDLFAVENYAYAFVGDTYNPVWRKSSQLAPSTIELARQFQRLVNNSCS